MAQDMMNTQSLLQQYLAGMQNIGAGYEPQPSNVANEPVNYAENVKLGSIVPQDDTVLIKPPSEAADDDFSLLDATTNTVNMMSQKPFWASIAGLGLGKLGLKTASRFVPGVGWALGAADAIDYFGYPIYDYVPGGDWLTWRDTTEKEEQ